MDDILPRKFPVSQLLMIGDDIKIPKESHSQPNLKLLHNSSKNQKKPKRFLGHHFDAIAGVIPVKNIFRAILQQVAQLSKDADYPA